MVIAGDVFADVLAAFGAPGILAARTNILCLISAGVLLPLCLLKVSTEMDIRSSGGRRWWLCRAWVLPSVLLCTVMVVVVVVVVSGVVLKP